MSGMREAPRPPLSRYVIADEEFRTKGEIHQRARGIAAVYKVGTAVTDPRDIAFLVGLFRRHPQHESKFGLGIARILVVRDDWNNRRFELVRVDGTQVDISWLECITPSNSKRKVAQALRVEIDDQIAAIRESAATLSAVCEIHGPSCPMTRMHVDHFQPTFDELMAGFLQTINCLPEGVLLADRENGEGEQLADRELAARWSAYHARRATYRYLCAKANLSDARRGTK